MPLLSPVCTWTHHSPPPLIPSQPATVTCSRAVTPGEGAPTDIYVLTSVFATDEAASLAAMNVVELRNQFVSM